MSTFGWDDGAGYSLPTHDDRAVAVYDPVTRRIAAQCPNQADAKAYICDNDPDGARGLHMCSPNACGGCGEERDGTGTCPNDCLYDRESGMWV